MLRANYHTHTVMCDGSNTAEEMVQQAISLGFEHLGFSGHMDPDIHMDIQSYCREIRRLQNKYKDQIDILMGVELDTLFDPSLVPEAEYIIGSTHMNDIPCNREYTHGKSILERSGRTGASRSLPDLSAETKTAEKTTWHPLSVDASEEQMKELADTYFGGDYYALARNYYEVEAHVYDRLHCTFIGHFDLVTRFNDSMHFLDESDPRYTSPALETMEYLVSEGVPFEINCGAVNRGRKKELYPNTFLLKNLHQMGGQILINSDAHQKEKLNGAFGQAVSKAIECGFTHTNILVHDRYGRIQWKQIALDTLTD